MRQAAVRSATATAILLWLAAGSAARAAVEAQAPPEPVHLRDRGTGVPTSQVGTYVRRGELFAYGAYAYFKDHDFEYDPPEFGFPAPGESKGRYRAHQEKLVVAYGWSDRVAVELEADAMRATLHRGADDVSGFPAVREESGVGALKARVDWRWLEERGRRPELFSYGEVLVPHDRREPLVGTPDWIINGGLGAIRGFRWGTVSFRAGFEWDTSSSSPTDWHEIALEYLKRVSPRLTVYGALAVFEGDEGSVVTELQWHLSQRVMLRLRSAQGLSPHGPDWAPEVGLRVRFDGG